MSLYQLIRPWIFSLEAETAHRVTLGCLDRLQRCGLTRLVSPSIPNDPRTFMGIHFPNPVGLAAGLDKNGAHIDGLAQLGFGFIEVGTVTPRPQSGNPSPRLFRLPKAHAIINRMGFNNAGVEALVAHLERSVFCRRGGVVGINIGKNADTPIERAVDDYLLCLERVYSYATYVTVNISSPNTQNLRQLQGARELESLLEALKNKQQNLAARHGKKVPMLLKIAPDLDEVQVETIASLLLRYEIEGVIATNTTLSRHEVQGLKHGDETGGLSGLPVRDLSTRIIRQLHERLESRVLIIGVGGILQGADAVEKIQAGASLVQLYTGLIYRGPELVSECARALLHHSLR